MRIITTLLLLTMAMPLDIFAMTNVLDWPPNTAIPQFKMSMLSTSEVTAIESFKSRRGMNRFEDADAVRRALGVGLIATEEGCIIEALPRFLMTEEAVIELLGPEDGRKAGQWIRYNIGSRDGKAWSILLDFKNGYLRRVLEAGAG